MVKKKYIKGSDKTNNHSDIQVVVIGTSAGGVQALTQMLKQVEAQFPIPLIIVQHLHAQSENYLAKILDSVCALTVEEADEKEKICGGKVYLAPANYHLLIEADHTFSLTVDAKINFSRPAIDVLFETAAAVYQQHVIGILLTGANSDGARGLYKIKQAGGIAIVEDPHTAEVPDMPRSALDLFKVDYVRSLNEIYPTIKRIIS
jgi:two-component system chemotaxis response regulator CheB